MVHIAYGSASGGSKGGAIYWIDPSVLKYITNVFI